MTLAEEEGREVTRTSCQAARVDLVRVIPYSTL